jgi:hypothetical protein
MPSHKSYAGGCHCGAIRFEAEADLTQVLQCNCSICMKRGALWCFVQAPQFKLVKGETALKDYQFNRKKLHHLFCPTCGVGAFSRGQAPDGQDTFAINVRCLDDIDVTKLTPMPFDGKSL